LARWIEAERHLIEALAVEDDGWIASHGEGLRGALAIIQQHLGWLQLQSKADKAEIW